MVHRIWSNRRSRVSEKTRSLSALSDPRRILRCTMNIDIGEYEPFHSDLAADVLAELSDSDDQHTDMVRVLAEFLEETDLDDAEIVEEALAVACLVGARVCGEAAHEEAREWLAETDLQVSPELKGLANAAFERGTRATDNALHDLWSDTGVLDQWLAGLAGYRAAVAGAPLSPVTTLPRDDEDEERESGGVFADPQTRRALAEAGAGTDCEGALAALMLDRDSTVAIAAACLVAARHSGMDYHREEPDWLAAHPLDPTPDLIAMARDVLSRAAPTHDVLRLALEGLDGERVVPALPDLPEPAGGEKEAKAYAKDLRTGGFFTGCRNDQDRIRILWCAARASELLNRPVEVTFRGHAANIFIPGFV